MHLFRSLSLSLSTYVYIYICIYAHKTYIMTTSNGLVGIRAAEEAGHGALKAK